MQDPYTPLLLLTMLCGIALAALAVLFYVVLLPAIAAIGDAVNDLELQLRRLTETMDDLETALERQATELHQNQAILLDATGEIWQGVTVLLERVPPGPLAQLPVLTDTVTVKAARKRPGRPKKAPVDDQGQLPV
jgi:hypothetical protein